MLALTTKTPDVVVLDLRMPEMDGITFLEVIRCYLRWSTLPVIVLTALPDGPTIVRAEQLGVRYIFRKSQFRLEDLAHAVEQCLPESGYGATPPPPITPDPGRFA
jgi:CheY-like chemotaxis protein